MANISVAKEATLIALEQNIPTFWWGAPGAGKSDGIRQLKDHAKYDGLIDFRAILRGEVDLRGIPMPDPKTRTTKWFAPDELPQEGRDGKTGILFLDELNAAHPQVQAAMFGLVLDRKLGEYKLPPGWRIVAAGNRKSDRSAAQSMPRALANRFLHIDIDVDHKQWIDDYALFNCDPILVAFMRTRGADLLHNMKLADTDDERRFPTPRAWASVNRVIHAPQSVWFTLVSGLVGDTAATELQAFMTLYQNIPDLDDIFARPNKVEVPEEPSTVYAVATALGRYADRNNFKAALTYALRCGREYEIIVAMDAVKRDRNLTKTAAYIDYVKRNSDVQIGKFSVRHAA